MNNIIEDTAERDQKTMSDCEIDNLEVDDNEIVMEEDMVNFLFIVIEKCMQIVLFSFLEGGAGLAHKKNMVFNKEIFKMLKCNQFKTFSAH